MMSMKKKPEPTKFDLCRDTEFATWDAKAREFRAMESRLDEEESSLLHRLANRPAAPEMDRSVATLLGEEVPDDEPAPDGLAARLRDVQAERRSVKAAKDIAELRRNRARHAASKAICAEVAPEYRAKVSALGEALLAAKVAAADLVEFGAKLTDADIAWSANLRPMVPHFLGERGERIDAWIAEAKTYGLIDGGR